MTRGTNWFATVRMGVLVLALPVLIGDAPVTSRMPGNAAELAAGQQVAAVSGRARGRAGSGLAGSPHDFTRRASRFPQNDRNADMCNFCHVVDKMLASPTWNANDRTRHLAAPNGSDLPLWNIEISQASYTMYQNGPGAPTKGHKASQAITSGMAPGSVSLLCLSCHDGAVAVNTYGNDSQLHIGTDHYLGNHHPIGFDYDAVRAGDREIRLADVASLTTATTVRDHLYGPGNTRMECGTCHSVHNTGNSGERLLWRSDVRSSLCLTCHDKGTYPGAP